MLMYNTDIISIQVVPYKTEYCNRHTQFVATAHCKECSKYMCEDCKESHRNNEPGHQVIVSVS
jgi:hypothetical protein